MVGTGYLIQVDHLVYEKKGGGAFTLAEAWRELRGVGNCRILRAGDSSVVCRRGLNTPWMLGQGSRSVAEVARRRRWQTVALALGYRLAA